MSNVLCGELRGWCKSFTRTEAYLSILQVILLIKLVAVLTFVILHFLACDVPKDNVQQPTETSSTETTKIEVDREKYTTVTTQAPLPKGIDCTWTPSHKTTAVTRYYEDETVKMTIKNVTYTQLFNAEFLLNNPDDGVPASQVIKGFLIALVKLRPPQDITFGCTLTIIANKWTLTAGSCIESIEELDSLDSFIMMEGFEDNSQGRLHSVSDVMIHPQYQGVNKNYDLAALKSEDNLGESKTVSLATLIDYFSITIGERFTLLGYGKFRNIDKDPLIRSVREVSVYNLPLQQCPSESTYWSPRHLTGGEPLTRGVGTETPICAGVLHKRGTPCNYCAGAPLLYRRVLIGVMSDNPHCGLTCDPVLYVNIALVRDWIDTIIYSD